MIKGLKKVINKKIVDISFSKPAFDLTIFFDDDFSLKLFCDETDIDDDFDNYSFFTPENVYTITSRSGLLIEAKK
jgi:hypothetical protein